METSDFDFENLTSIFDKVVLENISDEKYKEILVAYSGGIDSTALLYLANKFSKKHNKNTYEEAANIANKKIICKDGFCSLPNQKEISQQIKNDINLFDPI